MSNLIKLPELPKAVEISTDWITKRDEIVTAAAKITAIDTPDQFEAASELLRALTKTSNKMEAFRKEYAEPFAESVKVIKAASDEARKPLENAKLSIQNKLNRYAADQQRKQDEERKRIEAEQRRAIEEQLAKQQAQQAAADDLGLDDTPADVEPVKTPIIMPVVAAPRADAVRVQTDLAWTVTNEDAVPGAFKVVDSVKVNAWKKLNQDRAIQQIKDNDGKPLELVPGIMFEVKTKVISR